MSTDTQKADSIAFHFYTKLFYIVNHARETTEPRVPPKVDKWFNIESPDSELFTKEHRDPYRSLSTAASVPPLEIQVLLSVPELTNNQVLVYQPPTGARRRIDPTPRHILLETWTLSFDPSASPLGEEEIALPTIYKHGIPLFRSLFSLLRILPAWKLHKRLRRNRNQGHFSIHLRVNSPHPSPAASILSSSSSPEPLETTVHAFPPVPLTSGTLTLITTYLTSPVFYLDDLESLLSSRFLSLDDGILPTLAARTQTSQQRDSAGNLPSLPGSVPIRPALSRSPPHSTSPTSVVDKFIIPRSRTPSLPGSQASPNFRNISLPPSNSGSPSTASPLRQQPYPSNSRLRTVSATATDEVPIRRPPLAPQPNIFKSSTLSSSPSPHQLRSPSSATRGSPGSFNRGSPLTGLAAQSDRRSEGSDSVSSIGISGGVVGSVGSMSVASARGRKRYSSSFGHRYTSSVGTPISIRDNEGNRSTEYLQNNVEEDDISVFVQDIDRRRPLRSTSYSTPTSPYHRSRPLPDSSAPASPPTTEVLRTEGAVEEKLRKMKEMFEASLVGLGSGSTIRRRPVQDETIRAPSQGRDPSEQGIGLLFGTRPPR